MARIEGGGGRKTGYNQLNRRRAKPGGNPPKISKNINAFKPVVSKEMGPGVRAGNTFISQAGKKFTLGSSGGSYSQRKEVGPRSHRPIISSGIPDRKALQGPSKSTRQAINNFNKRFKNK